MARPEAGDPVAGSPAAAGPAVDLERRLPEEAVDCQPHRRRLAELPHREVADRPVGLAAGTCAIPRKKTEAGARIDPQAAGAG